MKKPNVLFLFSDQHRADVTGYEGHPDVLTPHLDKLAANGTTYKNAYCQDAICVPSRGSVFSGQYPRTLGCFENSDNSTVMNKVTSIQQVFQDNNYITAAFGKRHLSHQIDKGWTVHASHIHHESPSDSYVSWIEKEGYAAAFAHDWAAEFGRGPKGYENGNFEIPIATLGTRESHLPEGKTMEAWTAMRTNEFIKESKKSGQPFFCFSSFYRPHQPYNPLPKYYQKLNRFSWGEGTLKGSGLKKPASLEENIENIPPELQDWRRGTNAVWRLDLAEKDGQLFRDFIAAYYALVMEIDDHIASILKTIEEENLLDDTIIIYSSDHGDFVGSHGMVEKCALGHNVYEETIRVPLIFSWKNKILNRLDTDSFVELVDLFPTLIDLCGLSLSGSEFKPAGKSLVNNLTKAETVDREFTITENWNQATIVTKDFKYGVWQNPIAIKNRGFSSEPNMLFDRKNDPAEMNNLSGKSQYAELEKELKNRIERWQKETDSTGLRELEKDLLADKKQKLII